MTLRPGSFNARKPVWRGVLRDDGIPCYVCSHDDHEDQRAATACARSAAVQLREHITLPPHWGAWNGDQCPADAVR